MKYVVVILCLVLGCTVSAYSQLKIATLLKAPDGTIVQIFRDEYGIPHIKAENDPALFFGQGYAAAEDRLWQMEQYRRNAEGRLAEIFGSGYLESDKFSRIYFANKTERTAIWNALSPELQTIFTSYSAGINRYLDTIAANPLARIPAEIAYLVQNGVQFTPWTAENSLAVAQFLSWNFGKAGGSELERLGELQKFGDFWFLQHRPLNDTTVYTTIPPNEIAGINDKGTTPLGENHFIVNRNISIDNNVIERLKQRDIVVGSNARRLGIPEKFGSFGVLIDKKKSTSGNVMLLGGPQMDVPDKTKTAVINEVELYSPNLHVGGIAIAGLPLVILGHNDDMAWSFTSGVADNSDIFIDSAREDLTQYWHNGTWKPLNIQFDTIHISDGSVEVVPLIRTVHGFVIDYDNVNHYLITMNNTFRSEATQELGMVQSIYQLSKAKNVADAEAAARLNPMSFNMFYAGKDQIVKYFLIGKYIDRTKDNADPRLPRLGDGSQDWTSFIPFESLPKLANPKQGYFANWNNKPVKWWLNGDNIGWVTGEGSAEDVKHIDSVIQSAPTMSFEEMKNIPMATKGKAVAHTDQGSYQHAIEFFKDGGYNGENIFRPGQSGFVDINGNPSPHSTDLWDLFIIGKFKKQYFGQFPTNGVNENISQKTSIQVVPNPTNSSVLITVPIENGFTLEIVTAAGVKVRNLYSDTQSVQWDGNDATNAAVQSGIYFFRVIAPSGTYTGKCSVIR
jgi:penicillin amidase